MEADISQLAARAYQKLMTVKIMANYLAKGHIENELILFSFFVQNHTRYYVNSVFPEGTYDYSQKQMQFTVLAKTKIWNERSGIKK